MEQYHVRIAKDYLVFSAGHFITFEWRSGARNHCSAPDCMETVAGVFSGSYRFSAQAS
jgi:hypothetical protein